MAQKRPVAPDTPIVSYPTPKIDDLVISVDVDSRLPGYKSLEYGTLYPDQTKYPGAKLVSQTPLEDDRFVRRIYATDRVDPNSYNYAIKYSGGSPDHPIYIRTTIELRETYKPLPDNSPDSVISGAFLVDEEASPAEGELNSLYLKVVRIYETLPGPWIPYSRYDDDLGSVQGRRRSVINEGQVASLTATSRTSYEARDNSTGVYIESEETWSIKTDDDGNSLFPVKVRDFYDPSRGAVEERRQLFVPTGEEVGTLENVDGIITQTSYDVYNEYLSYKIVQTYAVDGPQLVGQATGNDGQLVTVTTQRKASKDYEPPAPTALRTVEVSREDAESVVERVVDTPELFNEISVSSEIPVAIPERYLVTKPITTTSVVSVITGEEGEMNVSASGDTISQQKQKIDVHKKRTITRTQSLSSFGTLGGTDYDESLDVQIPFDEYITTTVPAASNEYAYEADPLGGGKYLVKRYSKSSIAVNLSNSYFSMASKSTISGVPPVLKAFNIYLDKSVSKDKFQSKGQGDGVGDSGNLGMSGRAEGSSSATFTPYVEMHMEDINTVNIPTTSYFFFLTGTTVTETNIISKLSSIGAGKVTAWPVFKPKSHLITIKSKKITATGREHFDLNANWGLNNYSKSFVTGVGEGSDEEERTTIVQIPSCLHALFSKNELQSAKLDLNLTVDTKVNIQNVDLNVDMPEITKEDTVQTAISYSLAATEPPNVPRTGKYLIDYKVEPYKFGYYKVYAEVVDASIFA